MTAALREDQARQVTEYELAAHDQLKDDGTPPKQNLEAIGARLLGEFSQAKLDRKDTEERWLMDLRQYRGKYDPDEEAAFGPGRSRAYVRKTRVKVKTIDSRVADLLFPAGSEKNWSIDNTPVPSLSSETMEEIKVALSAATQGQPVTDEMIKEAAKAEAKRAAGGMTKAIEDQLAESHYKKASVACIHSGHLYGTGILKGPLVERRVRTKFAEESKDGKRKWAMKSETYVVPFVECTPIWNWYPDMAASTLQDCRYVYELHRMTKAKLGDLAKNKSFDKAKIVDYIQSNPHGATTDEYFDTEIKILGDRQARQGGNRDQYDVLERWGYIDGCDLKEAGVKVPDDRLYESFFANIWLLPNGTVIKAVLQPINGVTWPYHMYYFDKDETSIFGEGLAGVMRDDQKMLNAAIRMILDNGALTSGPMLEVNADMLSTVDKADEIFPWKVWLRRSGADANVPAVRAIQLPNSLDQLSKIAAIFESNADEVTAIPRYMSGENATQGAAGTAAGMSMLMAAANIVIKDLITAWDEGITRPFLEALYRWNMQFNRDPSIKGDFDVKARGTASLVAKEIRAQQLDNFANATANPMDAPYIKRDRMLRERALAHELSDIVKTEEEVKAEQDSDQVKESLAMQRALAEAQIAEAQGKAAKLMAEAELTKSRVDEMLANVKLTMASIDLTVAKTVSQRVDAAFVALQAGGAATNSPYVAPAGDEILRSAGWTDDTPDPSIAELNTIPVQQSDGTQQLVNKGAGFVEQPRATTSEPVPPEQAMPVVQAPDAGNASPGAGARAGIETTRIEP